MKNITFIILLLISINCFSQNKYIEYASFDAAQTKLDFIRDECKRLGLFDEHTVKLDDVRTTNNGTKFYVILDLSRTYGCDACYTQQDLDSSEVVGQLVNFPNYRPEMPYVVRATNEGWLNLAENNWTFPKYKIDSNLNVYKYDSYRMIYAKTISTDTSSIYGNIVDTLNKYLPVETPPEQVIFLNY